MARRASSGIKPSLIAGILGGIAALGIAAYVFFKPDASSLDKAKAFPVDAFIEDGSSQFRGGIYLIEGKLDNRYPKGSTELLCIFADNGKGQKRPIFVKMTRDTKSVNLERNLTYRILVEIDDQSIPVAQEIQNS